MSKLNILKVINTGDGQKVKVERQVHEFGLIRLRIDGMIGVPEAYAYLTLPELVQLATILQDLIEELKEEEK